jgi:hypothetical protein
MMIEKCKLCDAPAERWGMFVPTVSFSKRIGAKNGNTRMVTYYLCESCAENPASPQKIEDLILKECQIQ